MAKKKTKVKSKDKKEKKLKLGTFKETAREKLIGQHIGYRYDVNLLPDYKRITPFLKKYVEAMGWDDLPSQFQSQLQHASSTLPTHACISLPNETQLPNSLLHPHS